MASSKNAGKEMRRALAERMFFAYVLLTRAEDAPVTLADYGARVANEERRIAPDLATEGDHSASSVSRWQKGGAIPKLLTILAIANVVNAALKRARQSDRIDPGWLAFGDACAVAAPKIPTFTLADISAARQSGRTGLGGV